MAETPASTDGLALTTSAQAVLTAGGAGTWMVTRSIRVVNQSVDAIKVTIGKNTSASDSTAAKRYVYNITVQPGEPWSDDDPHVLEGHASTPDLIYALLTTGANNDGSIIIDYIAGP